ncbi:NAD(P)H-binding protein [Nocardia sp. NPDC049149]|uniref:NAD(P)H-binding protein n=1 Tax=Nocardia sp. NPDC049149 TaxID=3364315 RepID=UPI00371B2A57
MTIVIAGAAGKLGRLVVEELLRRAPDHRLRALVRNPEKVADLAARGVEVHVADYHDPASLRGAFHRGDRVLLISTSSMTGIVDQHRAVIAAAAAAEVALLAYTSILGGPAATFDIADPHNDTEQLVTAAPVPYALLRNGWYNENYTGHLDWTLAADSVFGAAGAGRVATAARADYAEAAAIVLTTEGNEGMTYELSGDTAWTMPDYAAEVSRRTGRRIAYTDLSVADYTRLMVDAGVPPAEAAAVADADAAIARGQLSTVTGELSRLIGHPTTPIADSIAAEWETLTDRQKSST